MSRAFRVGVLIVGALLVLFAGVFLIGNRELRFSSTYTLKAKFANVEGLEGAAEVRVGGVHVGAVKRIDLPKRPDDKVTVVMDLQSATRDILKKDSVAAIRTEGLLGDKYIEITFGSDQAARLNNGDTISAAPPLDIADLIQKTNQILDSSQAAMQSINGTADNLKSISSRINQGQGTVGALINDKTIYREASAGAAAFQDDMEALKHNFLLRGFFKKRGYEDSDELAKHVIARLPAQPPVKTFSFDAQQLFAKPDAAKLKNPKALNEAGRFLEDGKFGLAVVAAQGGVTGDTDQLRESTEAQAMVVREYLVQNFRFDDTRMKTLGLGKAREAGENVKVEILVYPGSSSVLRSRVTNSPTGQ